MKSQSGILDQVPLRKNFFGLNLASPPPMKLQLPYLFCSFVFLSSAGLPYLFAKTAPTIVEKPDLVLGQGEQRLLRTTGILRYSLGSSAVRVLSFSRGFAKEVGGPVHQNSLLLKGVLPGIADLWIWNRDGSSEHRTIRVEKITYDRQKIILERALGKLEEVEIIPSGKGVILRGEVRTRGESAKISGLLQNYPKDIFDETELSANLLEEGQTQLEHWLKSSKYSSHLRVERAGKSLWIRGNIDRPSELKTIEKQVRAQFPPVQIEIEALPDFSPTIYFRVFLLELKRNQFHTLGLSWPASLSGAFHVTSGAAQDLFQIDLTLQQLEGNGNAKILSNPELVVRAPGEAELFAGGELPIQTQSRYFSNISWKNYGLTLRLKVTHTAGDRVRLDIFTEVSHLDSTVSQEKVPGVQVNRMKTQVDAKFGIPLLLSGLLQQGIREEARGLPFLRKIPVLGVLFGSEDYLSERSELVAILYPYASPPPLTSADKARFQMPRGLLPPPREWLSPQDEKTLKESKNYPWNALE